MIDRYTIKFGPAVSQKQMQKVLDEDLPPDELRQIHKLKARMEVICDFDDLKRLKELMKGLTGIDRVHDRVLRQ